MPIHDWTRVSAGTVHDFHGAWIIHLKETLNNGLLPNGFYAQSEQHAGQIMSDVLTLQAPEVYVEPLAVGDELVDMPLFFDIERYVNTPLETAYMAAWRGMPAYWRNVLEK